MHSGELTLPARVAFDPDRHLSPKKMAVDNLGNPTTISQDTSHWPDLHLIMPSGGYATIFVSNLASTLGKYHFG